MRGVTATLITHVTGEDCQDQHGDEKMMSVSAYFYLYLSVLISSIWGLLLWFELSLSVLTFLSLSCITQCTRDSTHAVNTYLLTSASTVQRAIDQCDGYVVHFRSRPLVRKIECGWIEDTTSGIGDGGDIRQGGRSE